MYKKLLLQVSLWKAVIIALAYLSTLVLPLSTDFTPNAEFRANLPNWLWIWGNFDGFHYMHIAKYGYGFLQNPFFPLYPLVIRVIHQITNIPFIIVGQVISLVSFVTSLYIIQRILLIDKHKHLFSLLLLIMLFFPTSFAFGAVYNDSLFLLFTTATIYATRKRSFGYACVLASFATLTRLNGLALVFLILFEYFSYKDTSLKKIWNPKTLQRRIRERCTYKNIISSRIYLLALIPLVFISYLVYTNILFGSWEIVFSSMKVWNQENATFPLQVFWRYFKIIFLYPTFQLNYYVAIIELGFVIFYIALIIYSYKKMRLSYWVFMTVSILIPSLTGTFAGMPRYALHLYPMFLGITLLLSTKRISIKILYFLISIILLFVFITLFTRGYFVT